MKIIEQRAFGNPCFCGDQVGGSVLVIVLGKYLYGCVDDLMAFFFWKGKEFFVHITSFI